MNALEKKFLEQLRTRRLVEEGERVLEFVVRDAVDRRFENVNCAFSCNYQTLAVVGKVLHHFFLVRVGVVKNCVQIDHGN